LNANEQQTFFQARARFQEVDSVSGTIEPGSGLGPTFNGNSCAMCHAQPAVGGSSPGQNSPQMCEWAKSAKVFPWAVPQLMRVPMGI